MKNSCFLFVLVFLFVIFFLGSFVFAETIEEKSFEDIGVGNLRFDKTTCKDFNVSFKELYGEKIFSPLMYLNTDFSKDKTSVVLGIRINGTEIKHIESFEAGEKIFIRIPKKDWQRENNVEICVTTQEDEINIFGDSKIGVYRSPKIAARKEISKTKLSIGEGFWVKIEVWNSGHDTAFVKIRDFEDFNTELFTLVEGETFTEREIEPEEKLTLEYLVKALKTGTFFLKSPNIVFENVFGLEEKIKTREFTIEVFPRKKNMAANILGKKRVFVNLENEFRVFVENTGTERVLSAKIVFEGVEEKLGEFSPGEKKEVVFTKRFRSLGEKTLDCKVFFDGFSVDCQNREIVVTTKTDIKAVVFAFVIFAFIITFVVYLKKFY